MTNTVESKVFLEPQETYEKLGQECTLRYINAAWTDRCSGPRRPQHGRPRHRWA